MGRTYRIAAAAGLVVAIALLAGAFRGGGHSTGFTSKFSAGEREAQPGASGAALVGEGPVGGLEAYLSASRTYPANDIPLAVAARRRRHSSRSRRRTRTAATRAQRATSGSSTARPRMQPSPA